MSTIEPNWAVKDMLTPDPREDRLPRWAQDRLTQLRREVTALHARRGEGPEGANVHLAPRSGERAAEAIGRDVGVVFTLDNGERITVRQVASRRLQVTLARNAIGAYPCGANNVLLIGGVE